MPQAADAEVEKIVNGPESFTPDTRMIMGESAEVFKMIKNHLNESLLNVYKK